MGTFGNIRIDALSNLGGCESLHPGVIIHPEKIEMECLSRIVTIGPSTNQVSMDLRFKRFNMLIQLDVGRRKAALALDDLVRLPKGCIYVKQG